MVRTQRSSKLAACKRVVALGLVCAPRRHARVGRGRRCHDRVQTFFAPDVDTPASRPATTMSQHGARLEARHVCDLVSDEDALSAQYIASIEKPFLDAMDGGDLADAMLVAADASSDSGNTGLGAASHSDVDALLDSVHEASAPLGDVLATFTQLLRDGNVWATAQRPPLVALAHVLDSPQLLRVPPVELFAFFSHLLDSLWRHTGAVYDEALKLLCNYLLERRQQAHEDEKTRETCVVLGASLLERRIAQALDETLATPDAPADAALSLVLDLYASRLVQAGMHTMRLLRPIGLALVLDAVRVGNAVLALADATAHMTAARREATHDEPLAAALLRSWTLTAPAAAQRVWHEVALVLGSPREAAATDAQRTPWDLLYAYFVRAASVLAPFYPAPAAEACMPKRLGSGVAPSHDELCARVVSVVVPTRQAMAAVADAYAAVGTLAPRQAREAFAGSVFSLCAASAGLAEATESVLRALTDASFTRVEALSMLAMEQSVDAYGGMTRALRLFLLVAAHVPTAVHAARTTVRVLDDLLHVLCDRKLGVFLPFAQWDGIGCAQNLVVWTLLAESVATLFDRIPEWSRFADRKEMLTWIAQVPMVASYMVASADMAARAMSEASKGEVYGPLALPLDSAIGWLRLNHEELLQQLSDYIRRAVRLFGTQRLGLPGRVKDHAVDFLSQQIRTTRVEERKTLLSTAQMELLLDEFLALPRSESLVRSELKRPESTLKQQKLPFARVRGPVAPSVAAAAPAPAPRLNKFRGASGFGQTRPAKQPASKLAQLRNEFQLTRNAARRPHAPARAWEPDEPRAPPATSAVTGTVPTLPRTRLARPPESDTSSDEEEGAGGLQALVSPEKTPKTAPKPTAKPPPRRTVVMDDSALRETMRRAADDQRRRRLREPVDLRPLYHCLLAWPFDTASETPPTQLSDAPLASHVPPTFASADDYTNVFGALLMLEAYAQFLQARDEYRRGQCASIAVDFKSRARIDEATTIEVTTRGALPPHLYLSDTDLVVLEQPTMAVRLLARVHSATRSPAGALLGLTCVPSSEAAHAALRRLGEPGWLVTKLFSLTTLRREYAALCSVADLSLSRDVLSARVAPRPEVSEQDAATAAARFGLNEPQAAAVVGAMRVPGFSLVQGPPGTGKTKTIRALVTAFLARRRGERLLLCAPSNAAIDELIARIKDGIDVDGRRIQPRIVRLGRVDAVHPAVRDVTLDALAERAYSDDDGLPRSEADAKAELERVEAAWNEARAAVARLDGARARATQARINELTDRRFALREHLGSLRAQDRLATRLPEHMRHRLRAHVLEQAEIVCATLAGAGQEALYGHTFETVVIDEAVQAAELSALIPLRYECTRCILVGDPKQLPPTVLSQDAERRGYAQSLFVRLYNQAQSHVHLLSIQYRMHPNISLFPSAAFYGGRLLDGPEVAVHTRQPWHGTALFGPFRFFHVAALEETARGHSIQNRREAAVALDVYDALRTCAGSALAGRVGFVSMYKGQVDLLRSTFVARHGRDALPGVDFSSVDGFQGQEKDVIIISCVRSNRHGAIGFLSDQRRLNVALTRARCNMIVIGNGDMLQGASTVWRRLVQEAQVRGFYVKVGANTFEDPRRPAPRAEVARALPAPTWPPAAGPPHPQPARPPQARPAAPRATPSKPTPRTPPTEPAPAAPSGHTSTLPRKRSAPEPPSARQPPHVVPSSSLLQPKKPGKWASIVERNRARPTEPPKVAAAAKPASGPSWLRSARPSHIPKKP